MRPWARALVLGLLLSAAIPAHAVLAADPAEQVLLDKANFWRLKERPDLALDALNKLLTINPAQPDALYQYGMIEAQQGDTGLASQYLARLRTAAPASPHIAELENAIRTGKVNKGELNEARRLAQSGQFAQAAQKYQQTFGGAPPTTFGVEYYLTLAGTANGWEQARSGLAHLAQLSPQDSRIQLALAQVLTYRAPTRYDGIAALARLSKDPVVGARAVQAWRQALIWLGTAPRDQKEYAAYLAQYPQDALIRDHIAEATKLAAGNPLDIARTQGYADLRRGNTAAAERTFAADLRVRPDDPDALAGLGIIRLRQQRFAEARDLLGRAMRAAPARRSQWAAAYDSAVYYGALQAARAASAAGNYARARSLLAGIAGHGRAGDTGADLLLGSVDAQLGDQAGAERAYRHALAMQPGSSAAAIGLFSALTAQGKTAEAEALSSRLSLNGHGLAGASRVRAEVLRTDANNLATRGTTAQAMAKYQQAVAADPNDPWARLDFARFLAHHGEAAQGFQIVDPAASGNTAASLQAAAVFDSEQHRDDAALAKLDRIPVAARTPQIRQFRDQILVGAEIARAKRLAAQGYSAQARDTLIQLYSRPPSGPAKTQMITAALADIGDTSQALQIARESAGHGGAGSTQATIDYAGLLLRSGRGAEAGIYITRLENSGRLTPVEIRDLEDMKAQVAARRADQLRLRGDLADAYDQLSALLYAYPNDPTLLLAVGRLYAANGDVNTAMRFFDAGYQQRPDDFEVIRGAVGGAIMAKDLPRARAYLAHGAQLFPNNPRLYFLEAEIARAEGDNGSAIQALLAARALNDRENGGPAAIGAAPLAGRPAGTLPPNPFRRGPQSLLPRQSALVPGVMPGVMPEVMPEATQEEPASFGMASSSDLSSVAVAAPPPETAATAEAAIAPSDPRPVQLASADSDDLLIPPHAAARPAPPRAAPQVVQAMPASYDVYGDPTQDMPEAASPDAAPSPRRMAALEPLPPPPLPGYRPPFAQQGGIPAPQNALDVDIQRSMTAIEANNNPTVQAGLDFRYRDGEAGLSQLTEFDAPVVGTFSPHYTGTVRLTATPTYLTAGTPEGDSLLRFGREGASAVSQLETLLRAGASSGTIVLPAAPDQNAAGVALSAGYSYRNFAGEVGTSPLGFAVDNLLGRVAFAWPGPAGNPNQIHYNNQYTAEAPTIPLAPSGSANPVQIGVEGSREPITDSLLSYAGTKDPVSGATWGGVVRSGADAVVSYDDGEVGLYALGGGGAVDGTHVASNSEFGATVGGFVRPYRSGDDSFKVGVNLTYFSFDKNLRFFTYGQGGYFSPQNYLNVGVPLEYSGRSGRLSYLAGGALGIQTFDEDASPVFPTDSGAEAQLFNLDYPARSVTGPSFSLRGQLEYQLDNGFAVGGLASVDNAQNYTEGIAKVYLRKTFGVAPSEPPPYTVRPGDL